MGKRIGRPAWAWRDVDTATEADDEATIAAGKAAVDAEIAADDEAAREEHQAYTAPDDEEVQDVTPAQAVASFAQRFRDWAITQPDVTSVEPLTGGDGMEIGGIELVGAPGGVSFVINLTNPGACENLPTMFNDQISSFRI